MSFEDITTSFVEWLPKVGITISNSVEFADSRDEHQGRSLVSVRDIKEGDTLFSVPNQALLNVETGSLGQSDSKILESLRTEVGHWEGLILTILYELNYLKENSKWWPYLQILPNSFDTLVYWEDDELEKLQPSTVLDRLGKDSSRDMYVSILELIDRYDLKDKIKEVSFEQFKRVASCIMAYSFDKDLEDDSEDEDEEEEEEDAEQHNTIESDESIKSMVAVADILNSDTKLVNANIIYEEDALTCCAVKDIKAGEQIYNIYGNHPNAEILRRYGYVEWTGSKYDFGEVFLNNILEAISDIFHFELKFLTKLTVELQTDEKIQELFFFEDVVLDTFECYNDGEILAEAAVTIQILSMLVQTPGIQNMTEEELLRVIQRTVKKCQQLVESNRLTQTVDQVWNLSIEKRLQQYPNTDKVIDEKLINENFPKEPSKQRDLMALCVLKGEVDSLKKCKLSMRKQYKIIEDEKLLKNLLKRSPETIKADGLNFSKRKRL